MRRSRNDPNLCPPCFQEAELDGFLTALALCHTVQVTEATADDPLPSYQASSPDEKALVEACSRSVRVTGLCKVGQGQVRSVRSGQKTAGQMSTHAR